MEDSDLVLLDCTLRDGGYVNDWRFGYENARDIIKQLTRAKIDVVEVGFLRDVEGYDSDVTVCNNIEELNLLLPDFVGNTIYSAMAMNGCYDIEKLSNYCGTGIELIRVTFHDYDIEAGLEFVQRVKEKGYKVSVNPINIMGYSDERIIWLINQVNNIRPYQFAIVDTFGSMKRREFDRIVSLVDKNLSTSIRVALHLHENMSLSFCLAQNFIDKELDRPIAVDGSLMGMGRIPGNLPIELIADYANEYSNKAYDIDYLMDAINDHIADLKGISRWGYSPVYFLSAKFNLHRNYSEYYLKKGDLTNRDICHILSQFDDTKKTIFDEAYASELYDEYMNNQINDLEDLKKLSDELSGKKILVLAPGNTVRTHEKEINDFIHKESPVIISTNFVPDDIETDYAFFSNSKRFLKYDSYQCKVIITSNLKDCTCTYRINYNSVSGAFDEGCNSLIMLFKLLKNIGYLDINVAGADGYKPDEENYYSDALRSVVVHNNMFNLAVKKAIHRLGVNVNFITPSEYSK